MTITELLHYQDLLQGWAQTQPLIKEMVIFGSRVKGAYKPDSDLDIAIELDVAECRGYGDDGDSAATWMLVASDWAEELSSLLGLEIHLEWRGPDVPHVEIGLQIADLVVSPIGRITIRKKAHEDWKIIKTKFRRDKRTSKASGYGLIRLPKN